MYIVAQRNNALHDFVNDNTLKKLYPIPFKRYKHEPPALNSYKLIVISIEPIVDHCQNCKNGLKNLLDY